MTLEQNNFEGFYLWFLDFFHLHAYNCFHLHKPTKYYCSVSLQRNTMLTNIFVSPRKYFVKYLVWQHLISGDKTYYFMFKCTSNGNEWQSFFVQVEGGERCNIKCWVQIHKSLWICIDLWENAWVWEHFQVVILEFSYQSVCILPSVKPLKGLWIWNKCKMTETYLQNELADFVLFALENYCKYVHSKINLIYVNKIRQISNEKHKRHSKTLICQI